MKKPFATEHSFDTSYADEKYLVEFFSAFGIEHSEEFLQHRVRFHAAMWNKEYQAFCDYIAELGLIGVYPILL